MNDDGECVCICNCGQEATSKPNNPAYPTSTTPLPDTKGSCEHCTNYEELVYVKGDCTKFCVCQYLDYQHLNLVKDCPSGLYFDHGMQRCEWPLVTRCPYKESRME